MKAKIPSTHELLLIFMEKKLTKCAHELLLIFMEKKVIKCENPPHIWFPIF
jgi:hypothetical protein